MNVPLNGVDYVAYVYMASASHIDATLKPYHWYKEMVRLGAVFHGFPDAYIAAIASVPSDDDPDPRRRQENEELLRRMRGR
jgi:gamma-glutamylcyclotransferase